MTNSVEKCNIRFQSIGDDVDCLDKNQPKRKQDECDDVFEPSIFDIMENDLKIGDLVWAKLNGFSW